MPKSRIYTDDGYLELQWSRGAHICLVSGEALDAIGASGEYGYQMHQFTRDEKKDLLRFAKDLRRAIKQSGILEPAHRYPCVNGSFCGEESNCPPA